MTDAAGRDPDDRTAEERLDDLGDEIRATREKAEDDLEPGGSGRIFADQGVREQVEHEGDTEHPLADR